MSRERAVRTLTRIRDEITRCYAADPTFDLRHALLAFDSNEDGYLRSLLAAQDRFAEVLFYATPFSAYRFRRDGGSKWIGTCFLGSIGEFAFKRFKDQAADIIRPATDLLAGVGRDFGPVPASFEGWIYLSYCVGWDLRDLVDYEIRTFSDYHGGRGVGLFDDLARFESWQSGAAEFAKGYYAAMLSRDLRSCSVSAIDAILSIASTAKRPRRRDALQEERDRWIYEQCESGRIYKSIVHELSENSKGWDTVETVQRIQQIAKEYARRNGRELTPRRGF